jgi:hypothetical protein
MKLETRHAIAREVARRCIEFIGSRDLSTYPAWRYVSDVNNFVALMSHHRSLRDTWSSNVKTVMLLAGVISKLPTSFAEADNLADHYGRLLLGRQSTPVWDPRPTWRTRIAEYFGLHHMTADEVTTWAMKYAFEEHFSKPRRPLSNPRYPTTGRP